VVIKNYLGSINHTLLSIELLKQRKIPIAGIIFNGEENISSEKIILEQTKLPLLGVIRMEESIDKKMIAKYASKINTQELLSK